MLSGIVNFQELISWLIELHLVLHGPFADSSILCLNVFPNGMRLTCYFFSLLHIHTHTFNGPFPGLPRWAGTRKVKPIWIFLKQETVSGSGISWAICKSAPRCRQTITPAPHHSVFYRPDALPAAQPTASKHWRHSTEGSLLPPLLRGHVFWML